MHDAALVCVFERVGELACDGQGLVRSEGAPLDPLSVAPLALGLAGFPRSDELTGAQPGTCLPAAMPEHSVATYGRRPRSPSPQRSPSDPEMLERLKSLGYVR